MVRAAAFLLALCAASPVLACGVLEKAEPKVGSVVGAADHVTLRFSQALVPASSSIALADEAGQAMVMQAPVSSGNDTVLSAAFAPLAPGKYKVSWDVLWLDCGSRVPGDYTFTVRQ